MRFGVALDLWESAEEHDEDAQADPLAPILDHLATLDSQQAPYHDIKQYATEQWRHLNAEQRERLNKAMAAIQARRQPAGDPASRPGEEQGYARLGHRLEPLEAPAQEGGLGPGHDRLGLRVLLGDRQRAVRRLRAQDRDVGLRRQRPHQLRDRVDLADVGAVERRPDHQDPEAPPPAHQPGPGAARPPSSRSK